jgi:hypothetical protein
MDVLGPKPKKIHQQQQQQQQDQASSASSSSASTAGPYAWMVPQQLPNSMLPTAQLQPAVLSPTGAAAAAVAVALASDAGVEFSGDASAIAAAAAVAPYMTYALPHRRRVTIQPAQEVHAAAFSQSGPAAAMLSAASADLPHGYGMPPGALPLGMGTPLLYTAQEAPSGVAAAALAASRHSFQAGYAGYVQALPGDAGIYAAARLALGHNDTPRGGGGGAAAGSAGPEAVLQVPNAFAAQQQLLLQAGRRLMGSPPQSLATYLPAGGSRGGAGSGVGDVGVLVQGAMLPQGMVAGYAAHPAAMNMHSAEHGMHAAGMHGAMHLPPYATAPVIDTVHPAAAAGATLLVGGGHAPNVPHHAHGHGHDLRQQQALQQQQHQQMQWQPMLSQQVLSMPHQMQQQQVFVQQHQMQQQQAFALQQQLPPLQSHLSVTGSASSSRVPAGWAPPPPLPKSMPRRGAQHEQVQLQALVQQQQQQRVQPFHVWPAPPAQQQGLIIQGPAVSQAEALLFDPARAMQM